MESKTIAAIAVFTALSVALVLSPFKFPAPYAPFLKYQIWEIPMVVAFLIFGPLVGVSISVVNTIILLVVYPGDLPIGPLYNLAAVLSTFLGIYGVQRFAAGRFRQWGTLLTASSTVLGIISRVVIMSVVNLVFLRYPYPIGYSLPEGAVIAMLPTVGIFNATLTLYTIPIGYFLARAVSFGTKTLGWWQKPSELEKR